MQLGMYVLRSSLLLLLLLLPTPGKRDLATRLGSGPADFFCLAQCSTHCVAQLQGRELVGRVIAAADIPQGVVLAGQHVTQAVLGVL